MAKPYLFLELLVQALELVLAWVPGLVLELELALALVWVPGLALAWVPGLALEPALVLELALVLALEPVLGPHRLPLTTTPVP